MSRFLTGVAAGLLGLAVTSASLAAQTPGKEPNSPPPKPNPISQLLSPGHPSQLSGAEREAVRTLLGGSQLTRAQRDTLTALRNSERPGLTAEMRQALDRGLRTDQERREPGDTTGKASPPAKAGAGNSALRAMLDPRNPLNLTQAQREAVDRLLGNGPLTAAQRDLLLALNNSSRPGLTAPMHQALAEGLRRDRERTHPAGTAQSPLKADQNALLQLLSPGGPLQLTAAQAAAIKTLARRQPLTQQQRSVLSQLLDSEAPGLTRAGRLAIAHGLRDNMDQNAQLPPQGDAGPLAQLLDPGNSVKMTRDQREGIRRLLAGSLLTSQQRETLFAMLRHSVPALSPAQRMAVVQGLKDDQEQRAGMAKNAPAEANDAGGTGPGGGATSPGVDPAPSGEGSDGSGRLGVKSGPTRGGAATARRQTRRYLLLENATKEKLTVYVQYRAQNDDGQWRWVPGNPAEKSDAALELTLEGGKTTNLTEGGMPVSASRVRLWAVSEGGTEWAEYRGQELWLVPEADGKGEHWYLAEEMGTFIFTFSPG